jgi:hypothetical protein
LEEVDQLNRLIEYSKNDNSTERTIELRSTFYEFFKEYDKRKGIDIVETFPEIKEYWGHCNELYSSRKSLWNR